MPRALTLTSCWGLLQAVLGMSCIVSLSVSGKGRRTESNQRASAAGSADQGRGLASTVETVAHRVSVTGPRLFWRLLFFRVRLSSPGLTSPSSSPSWLSSDAGKSALIVARYSYSYHRLDFCLNLLHNRRQNTMVSLPPPLQHHDHIRFARVDDYLHLR